MGLPSTGRTPEAHRALQSSGRAKRAAAPATGVVVTGAAAWGVVVSHSVLPEVGRRSGRFSDYIRVDFG